MGVAGVDMNTAEAGLQAWLDAGFHGQMHYMAGHGMKRARPAELLPGTVSVLTVRMNYLSSNASVNWQAQEAARPADSEHATVSLYARGRDYHKVLRSRLQKLADAIQSELHTQGLDHALVARPFVDSAPVLEAELAQRSGIGWRGKHTLILQRDAGSMFFLGELYLNIALAPTPPEQNHCGTCTACITACPTQAIRAPYKLDARRCISYLTIEHDGPIPVEFRRAIGNRIYGCDDCQTACPWNKFAKRSPLPDFDERSGLNAQDWITLLGWTESDFLAKTEGSAIRRISFARWQRNVVIGAGNALAAKPDAAIAKALTGLHPHNETVAEARDWALGEIPGGK